jgi:hypothetical protein
MSHVHCSTILVEGAASNVVLIKMSRVDSVLK